MASFIDIGAIQADGIDIGALQATPLEDVAVLSSPTPSGTLGTSATAILGATSTVAVGTFYGVVDLAANMSAITDAQIKAGQNNTGGAAIGADSNAVTDTSPTADISGLDAETLYSYAVIQETTGGDSNQVSGTFTTGAASELLGGRLAVTIGIGI